MARDTSVAVYRKIESNGLLTKRRWEVYSWLFYNGPATANQVAHGLGGRDRGATACRLTELRNQGVVQELGTTVCPITSHTVILWDVTSNLPAGTVSRTRKTRSELEKEIVYLKDLLKRAYDRIKELQK